MDTEGTFRPERIRPIADRFNLEADAVLDNVRVLKTAYLIRYIPRHRLSSCGPTRLTTRWVRLPFMFLYTPTHSPQTC